MSNAFQWNCFNFVYTCNIALILFLKCDVPKFRIPPPPCHTSSNPSPLVTLHRPPPPLATLHWPIPESVKRFQYHPSRKKKKNSIQTLIKINLKNKDPPHKKLGMYQVNCKDCERPCLGEAKGNTAVRVKENIRITISQKYQQWLHISREKSWHWKRSKIVKTHQESHGACSLGNNIFKKKEIN